VSTTHSSGGKASIKDAPAQATAREQAVRQQQKQQQKQQHAARFRLVAHHRGGGAGVAGVLELQRCEVAPPKPKIVPFGAPLPPSGRAAGPERWVQPGPLERWADSPDPAPRPGSLEDELEQVWRDAAAAAAEEKAKVQAGDGDGGEYVYDEYMAADGGDDEGGDDEAVFEEEIWWDEAEEAALDASGYEYSDEDSNAEQDYPDEESSGDEREDDDEYRRGYY